MSLSDANIAADHLGGYDTAAGVLRETTKIEGENEGKPQERVRNSS